MTGACIFSWRRVLVLAFVLTCLALHGCGSGSPLGQSLDADSWRIANADASERHGEATTTIRAASRHDLHHNGLGPDSNSTRVAAWRLDAASTEVLTNPRTTAKATIVPGHEDSPPDTLLLIGVKTSVLQGRAARQAIRETWGSRSSLARGMKVAFLGCLPDLTDLADHEVRHQLDLIETEKLTFGDLLTEELRDCHDSYRLLVDKVAAFMEWVITTSTSNPAYIMIADDDIYLRTDLLLSVLPFHSAAVGDGGFRSFEEQRRTERYYAGQVWSVQYNRAMVPQRNPNHKNYLPPTIYPMQELPPFANGPHYLLSMDCVRFIAQNHRDLRSIGDLEDVSVASWLLRLQVYPQHIPVFHNLHDSACKNDFISLADLTLDGIQQIHANILTKRAVCHGFSYRSWLKNHPDGVMTTRPLKPPSSATGALITSVLSQLYYNWSIEYDLDTANLKINCQITRRNQPDSVLGQYLPSSVSFSKFCNHVRAWIQIQLQTSAIPIEFCLQYQDILLEFVHEIVSHKLSMRPLLTLLEHNLVRMSNYPTIVAAYSPNAKFAKTMMENLLVDIYQDAQVILVDESTLEKNLKHAPDLFVFSVLDGGCGRAWGPICQRRSAAYVAKYGRQRNGGKDTSRASSRLVMIAGEAWPISDTLDDQVILISTIRNVAHPKHIFIPVASMSFGERTEHSPLALLHPSSSPGGANHSRFCAYLYAQCDIPHREYMFDLLNEAEPVDALGVCQGSQRPPDQTRRAGRLHPFYNDDAVATFAPYKFVIAFENTQAPGYVTEKLVNAFLAGSVPIYFGHSASVAELFNPRSFIDCGQFTRLRQCADFVLQVHHSAELYDQFRREPPIQNHTAFLASFSWHPDVDSNTTAHDLWSLVNSS